MSVGVSVCSSVPRPSRGGASSGDGDSDRGCSSPAGPHRPPVYLIHTDLCRIKYCGVSRLCVVSLTDREEEKE